jgi:cyanophycinase-like exopeptidase
MVIIFLKKTKVHFSERGRQGRLHVLQFNTKLKYGFGVDEDTSLVTVNNSGIIYKRVKIKIKQR